MHRATTNNWIDRFFFIRYRDDGSHIRLRLHGESSTLRDTVQPALLEYAGDGLRFVPYEPELDRYGGPEAIHAAESYFHASSIAAFELTKSAAGEHSARLAKGLLAMLVFLFVFSGSPSSALAFARQHGNSYLRVFAREEGQDVPWTSAFEEAYSRQSQGLTAVVLDTWDRLNEGELLVPALDTYHAALRQTRAELEHLCAKRVVATGGGLVPDIGRATMWIGPSYVHMMNNRLGISITEEAYLGHLIARAFEDSLLGQAT